MEKDVQKKAILKHVPRIYLFRSRAWKHENMLLFLVGIYLYYVRVDISVIVLY